MADTLVVPRNGSRVLSKILQRLQRGSSMTTTANQKSSLNISHFKRHIWVATSADPAVDAGSQDSYPVSVGDLAYRLDTDEVFVCSVAPAAATAATFIQMHA